MKQAVAFCYIEPHGGMAEPFDQEFLNLVSCVCFCVLIMFVIYTLLFEISHQGKIYFLLRVHAQRKI